MLRDFDPNTIVLSHSRLNHLEVCPLEFKYKWQNRVDEKTPAMILGSLTHAMLTQTEKVSTDFVRMPEGLDRRTIKGKDAYAALQASNKIIVPFTDWENALGMSKAIRENKVARNVIRFDEEGRDEMLIEWTDKRTGLKLKGFIDRWIERKGLISDFKTAADASPSSFNKTFFNMNNDRQFALYWDGIRSLGLTPKLIANIVVESKAPYHVGVYNVSEEVLLYGRQRYEKLLDQFIYYRDKKMFDDSYEALSSSGIHEIDLPKWLKLN